MPNLNQCNLIGHLGRDPETRYTQSGKQVTDFSIAVNAKKDDPPTWIKVITWEGIAQVAEKFLRKGDPVYVSGEISNREYEHQGEKRRSLELTARQLQLLKGRDDSSSNGNEDVPF